MSEPVQEPAAPNDVGQSESANTSEQVGANTLAVRSLPSIVPDGFTVDGLALRVSETVTEAQFEAACSGISALTNFSHEALPYMLGDLINAGERLYPNKYEQWMSLSPYTLGTMRNYAWLCSRVPPENRGICGIQQTIVAARFKEPKEQRKYLERSAREGLSAKEFGRLARGEEAYKRKALPEAKKKDNRTVREQLLAAYERFFDMNGHVWQAASTYKDMGRMIWTKAVEVAMEELR